MVNTKILLTKAYEEYKKNPSRLSGDYYRSQRKMTQHMQRICKWKVKKDKMSNSIYVIF